MNRWKLAVGVVLVAVWACPSGAFGQDTPMKRGMHGKQAEKVELPVCPVMGEPVSFSAKTDTDDGPVYFCCEGCIEKYTKEPGKYAMKVAAQRKALKKRARVQVSCPLSGDPIDKKIFAEQDGKKVYFCCADCKGKYEKDPAKYAGKLEGSYTYQTKCPVMGGEINPTAFSDLPTGQRIYFCCPGCEKKLQANPEKYAKNLEKQGIHIDVQKVKAGKGKKEPGGGGHEGHGHP